MKKKRNIIRKNSGFYSGLCNSGRSFRIAADVVMTDVLPGVQGFPEEPPRQRASQRETLESETETERTYETNAFTITASGSVINGVETESETESETGTDGEQQNTADDGTGNDGSGSGDGRHK